MVRKLKFKLFYSILIIISMLFLSFVLFAGVKNDESTEKEDSVCLTVLMYHCVLKDSNMQNEYTVSPNLLENDLKYLKENGYTSVVVEDLINYVFYGKKLPEKCVMLTFDDGYYNNYYYAYPLLKQYGFKGVLSPIASESEKYTESGEVSVTYGIAGKNELEEMYKSGVFEIQNHSYSMHSLAPRKGVNIKPNENEEEYKKEITQDISKAQSYIEGVTGKEPTCFVYPFGAKSEITEQTVRKLGFVCTLTCTEKTNFITRDEECLFELGRYRRDNGESISQLFNRAENYKGK